MAGSNNPRWNNGVYIDKGYIRVRQPGHSRASVSGYVAEHVLIAMKALGHDLPPQAIVHHHDEDRGHNTNSNLVICENQAYHRLLHRRMRALKACGDPTAFKCRYCKQWEKPSLLSISKPSPSGQYGYHKLCATLEARRKRHG